MAIATSEARVTRVVWDSAEAGTATTPSGRSLRVGYGAGWSAEELLGAAAASGFMASFLQLADEAGIEVLRLASTASVKPGNSQSGPSIQLSPSIVVLPHHDERQLRELCMRALRASPVSRSLAPHLTVDVDIRTEP